MSNWTHVAGIIRVDDLRLTDRIPDFEKEIGKEVLFSSPMSLWEEAGEHPERFLPMGSEGSLQMSTWVNPDPCDMAAYTVSIFGDLRDHYDTQSIVDWFKGICEKFMVRQAVITVNNEWHGTKTYTYEEEK